MPTIGRAGAPAVPPEPSGDLARAGTPSRPSGASHGAPPRSFELGRRAELRVRIVAPVGGGALACFARVEDVVAVGNRDQTADGGARFDLHDLRLRLGLGCTAGEIRELAEQFGVGAAAGPSLGTLGESPSVDEAARQLLRSLAERGKLGELVAYLREAKPLVEWPEPLPEPSAAALADALAIPRSAAAPTVPDPGAAAVVPPPPALREDPSPAAPPAAGAAPVSTARPIRLDPTEDEAEASRVRPAVGDAERARLMRIALVAGAALLLVAAVAVAVGFAVGRANAPTASDAPTADGRGRASLARATADDLAAAVAAVAKACGLADSTGPARDVLAQAFRRCDRSSLPTLPPARPSLPEPPAPGPNAANERPGAGAGARPVAPAAPAGGGCIQRCQREHQQCKASECGPEPTQASAYEEYQRCLSRCLNRSAQCKMRCG